MNHRIELLIKLKNISPAQFADELDVQRANVSHILNGRNKPSLDFVQRIIRRYPDVNIRWLLFGEGEILSLSQQEDENKGIDKKAESGPAKPAAQAVAMKLFPDEDTSPAIEIIPEELKAEENSEQEADIQVNRDNNTLPEPEGKISAEKSGIEEVKAAGSISSNPPEFRNAEAELYKAKEQKQVVKIIFFYTDRTFETFLPNQE
jgi:transcriptional regulator with XRE-family HTH domain